MQLAKRSEFHRLGLVLRYSYAGSPAVQPTRDSPSPTRGDVTHYTPTTEPGALLPHRWLPDGSSLYDRLGTGFTLVGPLKRDRPGVAEIAERARRDGVPLTLFEPPQSSRWPDEFLLVRPDQHIAWRADDVSDIDLGPATGHDSQLTQPAASLETL